MNKEEADALLTEVCDKTKVIPRDVYKATNSTCADAIRSAI